MPSIRTQTATDPVSQAIARSTLMAGSRPVPLVSTVYDIQIRGGLADVVATRSFRNDETQSIEATLTFPLPVHAVLYNLEARIGGRVVKAEARAKSAARETYEDAVDRGKTAVLHEELLRGVHLLSVGHIGPGMEIAVTVRFALALARVDDRVLLHIPTTVGDIYGDAKLPDCDVLTHGGAAQKADLKVACDVGEAVLLGGSLAGGEARIALDAPIHVEVKGWRARELKGRAADGRSVTLAIAPAPAGAAALSAAVLMDHSGSMSSPCSAAAGLSKHAAALLGLSEAADDLRAGDQLHLWEFDDHVRDLGRASAANWRAHIRQLTGPAGGTEIGKALTAVLASGARDVVLVTDGKSHALDVAELARSGARFTVVLIGEDSLEANVGHLAALTGGEIFVPDGADVVAAVRSAMRALRSSPGDPREGHLRRSGMSIRARWEPDLSGASRVDAEGGRAAAAYAASLLLASVDEKEGTRLAEMEGLVTHLTSLVLVDEAGVKYEGLPATRKVELPAPRMYMSSGSHSFGTPTGSFVLGRTRALNVEKRGARVSSASSAPDPLQHLLAQLDETARSRSMPRASPSVGLRPAAPAGGQSSGPSDSEADSPRKLPALGEIARISWSSFGDDAATGNISPLDRGKSDKIRAAAHLPLVRKVAADLGMTPIALVLGLMARSLAGRDRHAARVARALLGRIKARALVPVAELLGLAAHDQPAD